MSRRQPTKTRVRRPAEPQGNRVRRPAEPQSNSVRRPAAPQGHSVRRPAAPQSNTARRAASSKRKTARRADGPQAKIVAKSGALTVSEVNELDALRREIERVAGASSPLRWNADPDDVQRSVAQLVLTLVEFIRKLLERQAIRRMEAGTLSEQQTEDVGLALMRLEATVRDIAATFGLSPDELNLDVGPLGKLM